MAGTIKCALPVNAKGDPDPKGKPCNRGKGHEGPHKPRAAAAKLNVDDIASSMALVTDVKVIEAQKRTRVVPTSAASKLAETIINHAHAAWVKAGKSKDWKGTPVVSIVVPAAQESAMRARIHEVAGKLNRKASFGQSLSMPDKKVKLFVQVRDLPKPAPIDPKQQ